MARGVGVNLGAVEADGTQLQELHFLRQFEHLDKNTGKFFEKAPPEGGQRVVVGVAAGAEVAEGDGVVGGPLDLAAGEDAIRIAIDQQAEQDGRRRCRGLRRRG